MVAGLSPEMMVPTTRILLIEDSSIDHKIVLAALRGRFEVVVTETLATARAEIGKGGFDLILLDVELPDGNGFHFFSELKSHDETADLPVFFLTMKGSAPDEVMGFSLGADDYLAKPVDPQKLRARVEAKLRKLQEKQDKGSVVKNAGLKLNFTIQRAYLATQGTEKELDLTPLEFKLLSYFLRHEDHVFSRNQLIDQVWGNNVNVIDRTVDMHVSNLRKKITDSGYAIVSLRGVGYRFTKAGSSKSSDTDK